MATKTTEKAETAKKAAVSKAAEKKPVAKAASAKAAAAKTVEKKPAAKKPVAKKEMKVNAYVEFFGKQVEEKTIIADVKKAWTKSGKKVGDIKTMDLYIKPEENAAYYVINGTESGSVAI